MIGVSRFAVLLSFQVQVFRHRLSALEVKAIEQHVLVELLIVDFAF